jgi:small subunit ribosomal protein S2
LFLVKKSSFKIYWRFFVAKELARKLINAGVHFGHGVSRWDPKMAQFIFAKRGNIHIIDVKKTLKGLLIAKQLLAEVVSSGKDVVFVGTKRQAQKAVEMISEKCGMHYVSQRWLGGMLTNFRTVRSRLQRLEQLEAMAEDGTLDSESKKQASRLKREMRKIKSNLQGVRNMSRLPGAVIVIDAKKEYLALREARKLGIVTVGILDTDSDPDTVDVAIPANDDSIRAIELLLNELADAVAIGKTMVAARQEPAQRTRRVRSRRPVLARANQEEQQTLPIVEQKSVQNMDTVSQQAPAEQQEPN